VVHLLNDYFILLRTKPVSGVLFVSHQATRGLWFSKKWKGSFERVEISWVLLRLLFHANYNSRRHAKVPPLKFSKQSVEKPTESPQRHSPSITELIW
jgi:hypothetical protein